MTTQPNVKDGLNMPSYQCPLPSCDYATGDVPNGIAIQMLTIHATTHAPAAGASAGQTSTSTRLEKVRRPTVSTSGTGEDWNYFMARWSEYKDATGIKDRELVLQLLECCDEELRKDLTRTAGGSLAGKTEAAVLAAIKQLAVREENILLARVELYNMRQDAGEEIRLFGARIRGQANLCKFVTPCPAADCQQEVNYMDHILRDVLIRGISDPDIRLDILQDKNQDMSLEQAFQFVEAKEAGKRSASKLTDSVDVSGLRNSSYRRSKKQHHDTPPTNGGSNPRQDPKCFFCGTTGHGAKPPREIRQGKCPAYNKTCSFCGLLHHIESVCLKKQSAAASSATDVVNCTDGLYCSDQLCSLSAAGVVPPSYSDAVRSSVAPNRDAHQESHADTVQMDILDSHRQAAEDPALDHHVYDKNSATWIKRPSKPQPFIKLGITIHPEDYAQLGIPSKFKRKISASLQVMADTGCQSCLISMKLLRRIGVQPKQLTPASMTMNAANELVHVCS